MNLEKGRGKNFIETLDRYFHSEFAEKEQFAEAIHIITYEIRSMRPRLDRQVQTELTDHHSYEYYDVIEQHIRQADNGAFTNIDKTSES